jgi:hypothetical protein
MNLTPLFFQQGDKKPDVFLSGPRFNGNNHGNHLLYRIKKGDSSAISLPWSLPGLQGYRVYFT